jgi:aspartate/tyrosine/aromatic aminotransferase
MLVAVSHSKNFGLYGERIGHLSVVTHDPKQAEVVQSNLKKLVRRIYSSPPLHGARIVKTILQSKALKSKWAEELANMLLRVKEMRRLLIAELVAKGKHVRDFSFLEKQCGFFSYLCLNRDQVQHLKQDYGVYMTRDSRVNVAGLVVNKIEYVVDAIIKVVEAS